MQEKVGRVHFWYSGNDCLDNNQAVVSALDNNQTAVLCTHKALCWIKWFSTRLQQLFQEAFAPIAISFIFLHRCSEGMEQNKQLRFLPFPLQSGRISFNQEGFPVPLGKTFLSGYFTLPPVTFCFCCLWVRCWAEKIDNASKTSPPLLTF